MFRAFVVGGGLLVLCLGGHVAAERSEINYTADGEPFPDSSYIEVVFNRAYPEDSQFAGQPYDYITVAPGGTGESFANVNGVDEGDGLPDIEIRVFLRDIYGFPVLGLPAREMILSGPGLCICPGGTDADAPTDINGMATFSGALNAGGCTTRINLWVQGWDFGTLMDASGRTVKINSTDQAHFLTSPCFTDASDLAVFAQVFGAPAAGNVCYDYNERGANIDASDLASLAAALGAVCQ